MKIKVVIFSATILLVFAACRFNDPVKSVSNPSEANIAAVVPTPSPTPEKKPEFQAIIQPTDSAFSKINWANFTYELPKNWRNGEDTITLVNGKHPMDKDKIGMVLLGVKYGEVTGDSSEEAIVSAGIITGGITKLSVVYIFTLQNSQPKLIWNFETGDRGDGGLKNVYAEGKNLVIELYGKDRYIFSQKETLKVEEEYDLDVCCPINFTKTSYKFNGRDFTMKGKWEAFPLPEKIDFNAR
jgi:hypothetical protein